MSDLVLLDDNVATIVGAVEEGRGIDEKAQKLLRFLFSTNLSEVPLVATGAIPAFAPNGRDETGFLLLPLRAAQILWINLVTGGLALRQGVVTTAMLVVHAGRGSNRDDRSCLRRGRRTVVSR